MKQLIRCYVKPGKPWPHNGAVGGPYLNEVVASQHLESLSERFGDDLVVKCVDMRELKVRPMPLLNLQ